MVKHISKIAHGSDIYYMKDTEARSALIDKTEKGVANGVATLDSGGKVPSSQLPSYVDDVEEYSSLSNFPATGESGKIYVDTTTNLSYRWSGSTYVTISSDLALGETSSTAYAGDKGKAVTDNFNTHAANTDIHVTAAEKEYWNNKVNAPSYSAPTAKTLTYTGSAQDLLNAGSSTAGTILYSTDETNWSTTIPQGTNVNTYTVYWRFVGSEVTYVDSTEIEVTIVKGDASYTAPTAKSGLVYDGTAKNLLNEGSTSNGTISYSSDGIEWSTSIPQGTNATDYTVYWKLTGDSNHNDVDYTSIAVNIAKVTPTVTAPTAKVLIYNTQSQVLVNAGSTDYGTIKYSLDEVNYSTTIPSATNVGFYTLYYKVDGDSNINDVSAQSVSCLIDAKTVNSPTITLATNSYIYNGSAKQPSVTSVEDGEVLIPSSEYTVEYSNNTNAGTGTVTISDANGGNYTVSGSTTFTINKAAGSVTIAPVATNNTYNGSAKVLATAGSGTGTMYYSLDNVSFSTSIPTSTNAGNWTLYYYAAESSNYTQSSTGSIAVSLQKATPSYSAPTAKSLTYNGNAQALLNAGSTADGTILYSSDNSSWSTTIPTGTNATSYTSYWKLVGDSNHTDTNSTSINTTIGKANLSASVSMAGWTYGSTASNPSVSDNSGSGNVTYSYKVSGADDSTYISTKPSNAGTYVVRAVIDATTNYNGTTVTNTFTIAKINPTYTAPTGKTGLKYNGSTQALLNAGSANGGTMQYSMDNSSWSTTIPSLTNAGTYIVYWRVVGDANHNDISSTSINIEIEDLIEGAFAVTTTGKEVRYANINTSTPSAYVGVGVRDSNNNIAFFIDKRFPTGTAADAANSNYKAWSFALLNKDQSYLTNITGSLGDGQSIDTAASSELRISALNAYSNGETGVVNTNNLCNDTDCASEGASKNAAKYCRSIANPVTGKYDGYLGSLAEWIVVNDNLVEINNILEAIGGVKFSVTASGSTSYTFYWTSSELSHKFVWIWYWRSSNSFAYLSNFNKSTERQNSCSRPFFPIE